ncbi:MAG: hypothetical protein FDZ69_00095 [Deltaproteobacteria bacterium]|nr:MAG: hypothetical protein FDZ69_00095 [Deltaproteobacteria bacterium]
MNANNNQPAGRQERDMEAKVSIGVPMPASLYEKIKLDTALTRKPVGDMVAEWIEQNVDPGDFNVDLETVMGTPIYREKVEPGVPMKMLTVPLTRRDAALLRMEAMRQAVSVRALLRNWFQENIRAWSVTPIDEAV